MKRVPSRLFMLPALMLVGVGMGEARADPLIPMAQSAKPGAVGESGDSPHALALRARWVTVPGWSLGPYLSDHTQLNAGWSVGLEYLYRRAGFDVVVSLDYSWLNADDGNFRGSQQTHYLHFNGLSALSGDVSLIGHWNLTRWLELRVGGGLGIGGVFGDIYQITNNSPGCNDPATRGDPSKCFPQVTGVNAQQGLTPGSAATQAVLEANACQNNDGSLDTNLRPCYRRTDTYPFNVRVVPVINTLIGLRFRAQKHVYVHLDAGWRLVGFYLGGGPEFRF